jgi:mycothione reductase
MKTYDLIILGTGSGNTLIDERLARLRTAIVEPDRFGGTCLNRGCIPSKMFVVTADAAAGVGDAARLGVHARIEHIDWPAIRDRVFGRIDPLHDSAVAYRRRTGVDVYLEPGRFIAPRVVAVGQETITAPTVVVATGSRPVIPAIDGLDGVEFHTSDTVMRQAALPDSMIIIGGGFIAAEMGHVFGGLGTRVTIVQQGPRLLMAEDEQIGQRFTELAGKRHRVLLDSRAAAVRARPGGGVAVAVAGSGGSGPSETVEADTLLVAVGRRPNSDLIDAAAGGLALDEHGHLAADRSFRTSVPGVWTLGDATNHFQLKHRANAEARVVRHNILHPDDPIAASTVPVPHAVFADPQVASVGLTEQDARAGGIEHLVAVREYADTAYGWALEDTTGFVKLLADPGTRRLLGAHIIGPQAATLIQPLLQGLTFGQTVDQLAHDVTYIHPALTEVVEQALLAL